MSEPTESNKDATEPNADGAKAEDSKAEAANVAEAAREPEAPVDPLTQARDEVARMKDAWMRTAADFDNFRKRSRKEVEDARRGGREDLLRTVLPVFDNLERAIQSSQRAADVKAVADGLSMVLKQFVDSLGRAGIQKVPTVGQSFDPAIHEAIQQVETGDHPAGTVIAEVQPGYLQNERLIRAAMVVVAKAKSDGEGATN